MNKKEYPCRTGQSLHPRVSMKLLVPARTAAAVFRSCDTSHEALWGTAVAASANLDLSLRRRARRFFRFTVAHRGRTR